MGDSVSMTTPTWSPFETPLASSPGPRLLLPSDTRLNKYLDQKCACLTSVLLPPDSPQISGSPNFQDQASLPDAFDSTCHIPLSLVTAFFKHIYPLPSYSFLHPSMTKEKCRTGRLEPCLALAIAGTVTWLVSTRTSMASINVGENKGHTGIPSGPSSCHCHGSASIEAAEHIIWSNLEKPTIPRLQALLLSISHYMQVGRFQRAFMLAAVASRFAVAMRLNHE
jgi:hypothetical protein